MMFTRQIKLTGKHGYYLKKYSKDTSDPIPFTISNGDGKKINVYIFDKLMNCYMIAAMVGIIEKKRSEPDKTIKDDTSSQTSDGNIFADIIMNNSTNLMRIYQHMILSESTEEDIDSSVKKAFSVAVENESEEEEKLTSYARGGLEIINEAFKDCVNCEDLANRIIDFFEKYGELEEMIGDHF